MASNKEKPPDPKAEFSHACYLMDYIDILAAENILAHPFGYSNFKVLNTNADEGGGAHEIISKLTSRTGLRQFIDIKPAQLGILQPQIRMYKLVYQDPDMPPKRVEFIFDDFFSRKSVDNILGGNQKRIGGAGLKEVSWKLAGTNPAEADKIINVDMKFEFQSAADLLGERYNPNDGSLVTGNPDADSQANFIDLILHPPNLGDTKGAKARISKSQGEYTPKFYQIVLDVGWARPTLGSEGSFPGMTIDESRDLISNLESQQMSLVLNLISHKFDIKENGAISMDVEYIGGLEESINGAEANILDPKLHGVVKDKYADLAKDAQDEMEQSRRLLADLDEKIECLKLSDADEGDISSIEENRSEVAEEIKSTKDRLDEHTTVAKLDTYKAFLVELQPMVRTITSKESTIEDWLESVDDGKPRPKMQSQDDDTGRVKANEDLAAAIDSELGVVGEKDEDDVEELKGDSKAAQERSEEKAQDPANKYIDYIFLGDILEVACGVLKGEALSNNSMVLSTGPIVIYHPRGKKYHFNLCDLPIAYADFSKFFIEMVVRPQKASYPLKRFVNDLLERLVKKVLQPPNCFPKGKDKRQITISTNIFSISSHIGDSINMTPYNCAGRVNISDLEAPLPSPYDESGRKTDCLFFFLSNYKASSLRGFEDGDNGSFNDRLKGIYHFHIGQDTGIIKSIDYTRTDIKGLREARQAEQRNLGQIRDIYNASVTMVGNTLFIPGMKLFLNPPIGMGQPQTDGYPNPDGMGSISNLLGIGGYYDVITVESTISRGGQYETVLDCVFSQSGGTADSVEAKCEGILASIQSDLEQGLFNGMIDSLKGLVGLE